MARPPLSPVGSPKAPGSGGGVGARSGLPQLSSGSPYNSPGRDRDDDLRPKTARGRGEDPFAYVSPSASPSHGATAAVAASQTLVLGDDEGGGGGGGFSRPKTARGRGDDPFGYVSPSRERDPAAVQTLKLDGGPSSSPGLSVSLTTAADNGASPIGSPYDEAEDVEYLEGEEVEYDEGEYADEAPLRRRRRLR